LDTFLARLFQQIESENVMVWLPTGSVFRVPVTIHVLLRHEDLLYQV
jgi:hypothetical protein